MIRKIKKCVKEISALQVDEYFEVLYLNTQFTLALLVRGFA